MWESKREDAGKVIKIRKAQISEGSSIFSSVPVTSSHGCIKNQSVHRFGVVVGPQGLQF